MNHADEDVKPFSRQGLYQAVYDIIEELPFYRAATALHMQWIRSIASRRPLVIEAGGGTGLMNTEARRVRRDADVYLLDINPAMASPKRQNRRRPQSSCASSVSGTALTLKS